MKKLQLETLSGKKPERIEDLKESSYQLFKSIMEKVLVLAAQEKSGIIVYHPSNNLRCVPNGAVVPDGTIEIGSPERFKAVLLGALSELKDEEEREPYTRLLKSVEKEKREQKGKQGPEVKGIEDAEIVNLTPHPVDLIDEDGEVIRTWPKCEEPPRLEEKKLDRHTIDGVPVNRKEYGPGKNVPESKEGTFYIVSGLVAQALKREDFLVPNTIRDEEGQILGCESFSRIL